MELRPAAFLDRDGTIIEEADYLSDPSRLRLLPGAAEGIGLLNRAGIQVILVTNQAGIGRGYFTRDVVETIHTRLHNELAAEEAHLDGTYYCPHHPSDGCSCRKPNPGLLLQAAREHRIDLSGSVMVGDKRSDLEAGRAVGCRTVLVLTGYGPESLQTLGESGHSPDGIVADLHEAVTWFLNRLDS